jgi:hypothetical protein
MAFWIIVVGFPAAVVALIVAFVVNRYLGISILVAIGAALALMVILNQPSHVEALVSAAFPTDSGYHPRADCHRARTPDRGHPVYRCTLKGSGFLQDERRVCVELLPDDEVQPLDDLRCWAH